MTNTESCAKTGNVNKNKKTIEDSLSNFRSSRVTGRPELGDVLHITLFSKETTKDGAAYHSFFRVVVRGNQIRIARYLVG